MNAVRENLIKARGLFVEKGWGQHFYSRNAEEHIVQVQAEDASCFCTMGAFYRAASLNYGDQFMVQEEIEALGFNDEGQVLSWNDNLNRPRTRSSNASIKPSRSWQHEVDAKLLADGYWWTGLVIKDRWVPFYRVGRAGNCLRF